MTLSSAKELSLHQELKVSSERARIAALGPKLLALLL